MPELPPGPGLGSLVQSIAFARDPLGVLLRARARYGPVFTLRFAGIGPVVVVAAPEAVDQLVPGDPERSHAGKARRAVLPQASEASVFGADDERHRAARERIEPAFGAARVGRRSAEIAEIAERHVGAWPTGRPFRALSRMRTLMEDVFVRTVLQIRDEERAGRLVDAVGKLLRTPGNPPVTPLDRDEAGPLGAGLHRIFERRLEPVRAVISDELAARRAGGTAADGILADMLAADPGLTTERAVDELVVVMAAAQEPPAIAHTWVLHRLARDPALAERLAAEPNPGLLDAVVDETLRLRPPAMASLRRLTAPAIVGAHTLPAGTDVMVSIPLIQRDPSVFADPAAFRPERFLDAPPPPAFFPFGGGRRRCPGEALAWIELRTIVPIVARRLRLRPAWPREERPVQRATVLVPHRSGLLVARPR